MNVATLVAAMEAIAPTRFAATWDNVGLLVGDETAPLSRVLLTIDCTPAVLREALALGCEAIVSYHPPLFSGIRRVVAGSMGYALARAGLAVHSPHTALDVAEGGTNDVLADALGMTDRVPLRLVDSGDDDGLKLVTFVPESHVDAVSRAVFDAGAGHIGHYESCSFRTPGIGTFFGQAGARPAVGSAGRLEQVPELRLETRFRKDQTGAVVRALVASHPYEEPAFDLVRLARAPSALGFGRVGTVPEQPVQAHIESVKRALGVAHVLVGGDRARPIARAAACAGSGGDLVPDAIASGAQLLVTGELRHHDALAAIEGGLTVVCTLHSVSERRVLVALAEKLKHRLPGVTVLRSEMDHDPFAFA